MTDLFAVLGLPRRPDPGDIKEEYLRRAALLHPDASTGDTAAFQVLQEAFRALGDPSARLRHLLELTFPQATVQTAPMQGELFMQVGATVQQATDFCRRWDSTRTPLARAVLAEEKARLENKLREVAQILERQRAAMEAELKIIDSRWPEVSPEELNQLAAGLAFISRWQSQLGEWEFRLAHA